MAFIYREWRVVGASAFALLAIAGAYLLARGAGAPRRAEASTESALLQAIATKDSTGDGLPDWEKSLYGIPLNATTTDYFHLGMTDGEAVAKGLIVPIAATPAAPVTTGAPVVVDGIGAPAAGSLTDTFAKNFFALYVSASQQAGGTLSSDQINALAQQALDELTASATPAPDFKSMADIKAAGSGPDALKAYAASAEAVFNAHGAKVSKGELAYLQDYLNGDQTALPNLSKIAAAYIDGATGLAALTVPKEAAPAHLALVNSLARIGEEVGDFSHVNTDPLTAMLALQQYTQTVLDFAQSLSAVSQLYAANGIVIPSGAPGASFVNLAPNIAASQQKQTP